MTQKIQLQLLPLSLKNNININQLSFSTDNCAVSVFYTIYDKKKKIIVNIGSSKACGQNKDKSSIHAEELAIQYLRNMNNLNRYIIYIYRYSKDGHFKPAFCCQRCSKLIHKYNLQNKIFTIDHKLKIISAMGSPYITLGYLMKNKLF